MSRSPKGREEMETFQEEFHDLIGEVGRVINAAEDAQSVLLPLCCLASLLRDTDVNRASTDDSEHEILPSMRVLEEISQRCREKASTAFPGIASEGVLSRAFYGGPYFGALARLLLQKVSVDWLACFSAAEQSALFDDFFTNAPLSDAISELVDGLSSDQVLEDEEAYSVDSPNAACAQAQRLLVWILISNEGVKNLALSLSSTETVREGAFNPNRRLTTYGQNASHLARLISSVPDRTSLEAPTALRFPDYADSVVSQLLVAAEENWRNLSSRGGASSVSVGDITMKFIGEVIGALCRRGHAAVVASQMAPPLLQHVRIVNASNGNEIVENQPSGSSWAEVIRKLQMSMWPALSASITDSHALERFSECLMKEMASKAQFTNVDAYCIIHTFYGKGFIERAVVRSLFSEKFLFWKVLPIRCLKWVLDFAVISSEPASDHWVQTGKGEGIVEKAVVRRLGETWGTKDFIQSAPIQQQNYVTAALGMCLRSMDKDALDSINGLVQSLLKGISSRLDSPVQEVRRMARQIALAFSVVVNPGKPLLFDEDDRIEDLLNWEELEHVGVRKFSMLNADVEGTQISAKIEKPLYRETEEVAGGDEDKAQRLERLKLRKEKKERLALEEDDPDAIVRLGEESEDEDSENSSGSDDHSESSLRPYDISDEDDDVDRRKITQLQDLVTKLRKGDKCDEVEDALEVAEKLILAMPDELDFHAADLTHALVHVKCSVVAVEGEDDIAEERRHRALVAVVSCSPLGSVSVLTTELFSQHVDASQRILILDVMAVGAKAIARGVKGDNTSDEDRRSRPLTNGPETTDSKSWFTPGGGIGRKGTGPWMEVASPLLTGTLVGWGHTYERELPPKQGQIPLGKSRRWGQRAMQVRESERMQSTNKPKKNEFASLAAAFMLPVMRDYDKQRRGLDVLGRDFLVLGGILSMLGVCMECIPMQQQATILGGGLLEMLRSRDISSHSEVFVRRTALFAASRVLLALNPSDVAASLTGSPLDIVANLDWVRGWALEIARNDADADCCKMAIACVQIHSEMALNVQHSMVSSELPGQTVEFKIPSGRSLIMPF